MSISVTEVSNILGISEVTLYSYAKKGYNVKLQYLQRRIQKIKNIRTYIQKCYFELESKELATEVSNYAGVGGRNKWVRFFREQLFSLNDKNYKLKLSKYELLFYKYCRRIKCLSM